MRRIKLHEKLKEALGSNNVYFQPPASIKLQYPAIVYSRSRLPNIRANNGIYVQNESYTVTLIDKNPDSVFIEKLIALPKSTFDRQYVSDNLYHFTFTIFC